MNEYSNERERASTSTEHNAGEPDIKKPKRSRAQYQRKYRAKKKLEQLEEKAKKRNELEDTEPTCKKARKTPAEYQRAYRARKKQQLQNEVYNETESSSINQVQEYNQSQHLKDAKQVETLTKKQKHAQYQRKYRARKKLEKQLEKNIIECISGTKKQHEIQVNNQQPPPGSALLSQDEGPQYIQHEAQVCREPSQTLQNISASQSVSNYPENNNSNKTKEHNSESNHVNGINGYTENHKSNKYEDKDEHNSLRDEDTEKQRNSDEQMVKLELEIKNETDTKVYPNFVKEENSTDDYDYKLVVKEEPLSQDEADDVDVSTANICEYNLFQFKEEEYLFEMSDKERNGNYDDFHTHVKDEPYEIKQEQQEESDEDVALAY